MQHVFRIVLCAVLFACVAFPVLAEEKSYRVEVLQVAAVPTFQDVFDRFVQELGKNGIVKGKNLVINRTVIDFDVEKAGLWKKVGLLIKIRSEASRIAKAKPDLALTIGTPATKYAKDKIIEAGIPLVFTAVSFPTAAGCRSLTDAGPGFTGATTYMNARDALKITKLAFPGVKILGIVHSDDDAAVTHVAEIKQAAPSLGFTVLEMQVSKNDPIKPAAQELIDKGAQAFVFPLDTYYGMRNNEPSRDLNDLTKSMKIPGISFVYFKMPGAVLYVGSDFGYVGGLSGQQAMKIMKEGAKPETLPIMRQTSLTIMVDEERIKTLGLSIPMEVLQLAKSVK